MILKKDLLLVLAPKSSETLKILKLNSEGLNLPSTKFESTTKATVYEGLNDPVSSEGVMNRIKVAQNPSNYPKSNIREINCQ